MSAVDAPHPAFESPPPSTDEELTAILDACFDDGIGGLARHVELDLGDIDDPSIEPYMYQLLGVLDSTNLLFGVSMVTIGDLADSRAEHGDPLYRINLGQPAAPALNWEIWQAPATALWNGPLAGASLVLPANTPGWVVYTDPSQLDPILFPTSAAQKALWSLPALITPIGE
jgi:hypothetical protein